MKELKQLIYIKFLWSGKEKVIRLSTINEYDKGGLKMTDPECLIKSLRLAWLQRIFNANEGPWKWYLSHLLAKFGGLFMFNCNYNTSEFRICSLFYYQLLQWWSDFREDFASSKDFCNII